MFLFQYQYIARQIPSAEHEQAVFAFWERQGHTRSPRPFFLLFTSLLIHTKRGAYNTGCLLVLGIGVKVQSSLIRYRRNKTISDIQPDSRMYRVGLDRIAKNSNADTISMRGGNMETHVMVSYILPTTAGARTLFSFGTSRRIIHPWTLSRGGGRGQ